MAPISPSASFLLPINHRGGFFEDVIFQDAREDFHHAIQDVLSRLNRGREPDTRGADRKRDLSCYRKLQDEDDFDEDSQALTITEDDNNRKILLDVKEFHPNGDVKVHAVTDRELFVEGHNADRKTGRAISFTRTFMLPWYADLSCGYFSVDISSDGVLRIVTTKKAPSTGRSIPLVIECEAITEDEFNQESYVNNSNHNSRSNSNSRKVSMSTNSSQQESFNYTNGTVNNNTESVHCTSQDTMREMPQNSKKGKIIPIAIVKNEFNTESEKVSQSFSSNQESATSTNQNGFAQYSSNRRNSSSSPSNKNRLIKTVITTTFDVKSNTDQSIPAKQQEIVIPVKIDPKSSDRQKNTENGTKQHQQNNSSTASNENSSSFNSSKQNEIVIPIKIEPKSSGQQSTSNKATKQEKSNRNTTSSQAKSSFPIPNLVNVNQKNEDSSSRNSKVKQTISDTNEKKKDKTKDADSAKSKTPKKLCLNILNKKPKADTSDKHKKDMTKDNKQRTYPKEFVIPLTIEGESSDDVPFKREAFKKVEVGKNDQSKNTNGKKPPINQKVKPKSPLPKKLIISDVFKGQEEKQKEVKRGVSSENKPPPIPRHERSSSIEERVSVFTRRSPVAERKSRRDVMDEIRGNSRGARSRSRSIEELVSKFDKMSPQVERRVLMRKNSQEEKTEISEKKQSVNRKESIIPIEIEGYTKTNHSDSGKDIFHNSYSNNYSSSNGTFNRLEENENKGHKPLVKRKESIIPIKLEYEENEDSSFVSTISDVSSSIDEMINQINNEHSLFDTPTKAASKDSTDKYDSSESLKTSNANEKEQGKSFTSTPNKENINDNNYYSSSPSCISNDITSEKYTKGEDDSFSSISSPSVIEDANSLEFADEESTKKSKDKSKKSSKKKVKRKQSIPGVQVSDDETGGTTVLLAEKSTSSTNRKKKNADSPTGLLGDSLQSSLINAVGNDSNKFEGTANNSIGFNNENISNTQESSDKVVKETSAHVPEISNKNIPPEERNSENTETKKSIVESNDKIGSRRNSVLPSPSDMLKIKPPKKNKKEKSENNETSHNSIPDSSESEGTEKSRRASVLPNPTDLLKIKPPKKNKKENTLINESCQNDSNESSKSEISEINKEDANNSRRTSVLPNPADLLKIKPPKKSSKEVIGTTEKSMSSENPDNSKNSQNIQKPKEETSTKSKTQENQTESQQIQSSKHGDKLDTKVDIITEKVTDNKALKKISENSLNPESTNNSENNMATLEPPPTPSLRRKTSFKKYKVFENKRTPSPSPIRRPDTTPTSPKTEQILINKIEESSNPKQEETNTRKKDNPLTKEEPLSSSKNSKINSCVTIETKDMFFSDPFFKDHRQLFMGGVREALKRSGITSMRDKLKIYRDLRLKGPTEDNQAICSAEDETSYKAVLDMNEFMEGEIKVKTMSSTEIIIEGISKTADKSAPFLHSLPFPDSIRMEAVEASLSEDGILAINAPKTNPDTEE